MKIVLTTHQFVPDFYAGTEVLTFNTAKEIKRLGHEVSVFTGYPGKANIPEAERFDQYVYEGISVDRFYHARVPMGGQTNIIEAEYNNLFFATNFRDYLEKSEPDLVHFFHLSRLSASAIDVCEDLAVPMVLTPTDFWFVCAWSQLRLPDNSICPGPDPSGVNCLKHVVSVTQRPSISAMLEILPHWVVATMIWGFKSGMFSKLPFSSYVRAVSRRTEFLRERINKVDKVIVPTRLMENVLTKHGLDPGKVVYSPYGINLQYMEERIERGLESKLRVGFIGTLWEHKGPDVLIKAVRSIPDDVSLEVKIYGRTDDAPDYVKGLKRLAGDDPRITFRGSFPNHQIGEVFSELDVLIVPSVWLENTPLVIYSAQAAGCPVVASNLGGITEAVRNRENGLLFEAGDVSGLASAIELLAKDRGLLRSLAAQAPKAKSAADYARELTQVYAEVLMDKRVAV